GTVSETGREAKSLGASRALIVTDPGVREAGLVDAVIDALSAALRAGQAPTTHGVRPHITITVALDTVRNGAGPAQGTWTGPVAYGQVRHLLDDAGLAWLAVDRDGLPLAAGPEVRTVPAGPWRALVHRDGGCIAKGCDAPPAWCDVMHLGAPHAQGGRLTLHTAGLGCRYHHRRYDHHTWQITWTHQRPILHPPGSRTGPDP
ncbi:MAG: iron-containing alcohol dehydrogenase, partial [Actinobacteria bacterium]|nr:iron-containing alcohol dehydrogenase [Actinomycetota bacterium]